MQTDYFKCRMNDRSRFSELSVDGSVCIFSFNGLITAVYCGFLLLSIEKE